VDWSQPNLEALSWAGLQLLLALPFAAAVATARGRAPVAAARPAHAVGK
jgi:hypothetical protein